MLTWQNNSPRFVIDGHVGDKLTLHFGSTNRDDIEISEFYFIAKLVKHEDRWSLDAQLHQTEPDPPTPKPQVGTLTSKLQLAIEKGKDFDFRKYFENWSKKYRDFSIVMTDTTRPHVNPIMISPRQYTQDDVDKGFKNGD